MKSSNNDIEKELNEFYKKISKVLPQDGRKTLLPDIKTGVDSYLVENPEATIDDVISYVGTPECIANEYYANQDGKQLTKEIKIGKKILMIVAMSMLLAALIFAAAVFTSYVFHNYFDHGFIEYEVDVISCADITPTDYFE